MSKNLSILGSSVVMNGNICSNDLIDVNGKFDGTIIATKLTVKNSGYIKGNVYANELVMCNGVRIEGNIYSNRITMLKNSVIEGEVNYCFISIEEKASIVGNCNVVSEDKLMEIIEKKKDSIVEKQDSK